MLKTPHLFKLFPLAITCLTYPEHAPSLPPFVQIDPLDICNLHCKMCQRNLFLKEKNLLNQNILPYTLFKKIIDEIHPYRVEITGLGEPLLHPDFLKMISYAKKNRSRVLSFSNGTLISTPFVHQLVKSKTDTFGISIDAASRETYKKIRGADLFLEVIEGIKKINKMKAEYQVTAPHLSAAFCIQNENIFEIEEFIHLCHLIKTDSILFQLPEITQADIGIPFDGKIKDREVFKRLKKAALLAKKLSIQTNLSYLLTYLLPQWYEVHSPLQTGVENKNLKICLFPWIAPYITVDGWVKPCCVAGSSTDRTLFMGNIQRDRFSDIWNNRSYVTFRRAVAGKKNTPLPQICKTCIPRTLAMLIKRFDRKKNYGY